MMRKWTAVIVAAGVVIGTTNAGFIARIKVTRIEKTIPICFKFGTNFCLQSVCRANINVIVCIAYSMDNN